MAGEVSFTKMHGTGNDFIVLDGMRRSVRMTPALARRLCDRHFGVGADQILILLPSATADLRMRIVNADGSEVEMCGNGIRCLARYARDNGHVRRDDMTVETLAGVVRPVLRKDGGVRVDMGAPILEAARIPTRARGRVIERPLASLRNLKLRLPRSPLFFTCVSMGNPHAVIFMKGVEDLPADVWGPALETHPFFPRRTNVEFVEVTGPETARVRVWERGAGLTMACGTGACAVTVAGVLTGRLRRAAALTLPGGVLRVEWAPDDHVYLTGPAEYVFRGRFFL
ncbi:MAG TPA: diaminopimelate epimerase [Elusimicrobiota bacterium]|nr:diaminopimelate epimerase [Elusimicrobiota bacterium]